MPNPLVVFISGKPASGKTTLAKKVKAELIESDYKIDHLPMDNYYKPIEPHEDVSKSTLTTRQD